MKDDLERMDRRGHQERGVKKEKTEQQENKDERVLPENRELLDLSV